MMHAMVMYDFDDNNFLFKNSYTHQPVTKRSMGNDNPRIGYYIDLWKIQMVPKILLKNVINLLCKNKLNKAFCCVWLYSIDYTV